MCTISAHHVVPQKLFREIGMIFDEKVLAQDLTPEGQARKMEFDFIATTIDLMREKADPAVLQHRISYILMGITGVIYGNYKAEEKAPIPLPPNAHAASQVREMWKCLIVPTRRYCQISGRASEDGQMKRILLRMHDHLFQSMRNSIFR
jgi:hypothetical protein